MAASSASSAHVVPARQPGTVRRHRDAVRGAGRGPRLRPARAAARRWWRTGATAAPARRSSTPETTAPMRQAEAWLAGNLRS